MTFVAIPPTLREYEVPTSVLQETRHFLWQRGRDGCEGVVLWLGRVLSPTRAEIMTAYPPRQIAYRTAQGLAVEIPEEERLNIAINLPRGLFVLVKVHSHAEDAYHSPTDDANPYLNHEGAVSIVVPHFARAVVLEVTRCSVNVFSRHSGWTELEPAEVRERFVIKE